MTSETEPERRLEVETLQELSQTRLNHADMRRTHALEVLARAFRWTVLAAILLLLVVRLSDVLLLIFAAILVAIILRKTAAKLARYTPLGDGWALALVIVVLAALFLGFAVLSGEGIADQMANVWSQLTAEFGKLQALIQEKPWGKTLIDNMQGAMSNAGAPAAGAVAGFANGIFSLAGALVVLAVTAIYMAAAPELYVDGMLRLLPVRLRSRGREVLLSTGDTLVWWFVGQFADMVFIGVLTYAGLLLLGVKLASTLALIAALCNFVPYIGALVGAVPAILVALGQGGDEALWVAGLFVVVQGIEGNLVAPLIQKRTVHLPPALTIVSQTVLGTLFGPMGLILATPLVATAMNMVRMVYVEGMLEGTPPPPARQGG